MKSSIAVGPRFLSQHGTLFVLTLMLRFSVNKDRKKVLTRALLSISAFSTWLSGHKRLIMQNIIRKATLRQKCLRKSHSSSVKENFSWLCPTKKGTHLGEILVEQYYVTRLKIVRRTHFPHLFINNSTFHSHK